MDTDKIDSRDTFINFVDALNKDLDDNPENWENIKLTDFLAGMARYTADIQGYYNNTKQPIDANTPSWRVFADILMGASIYE